MNRERASIILPHLKAIAFHVLSKRELLLPNEVPHHLMVMVQRQRALRVSENIREGTPPGLKGPTRTHGMTIVLVAAAGLVPVREILVPGVAAVALRRRPEPGLAKTAQARLFEVCVHQV